MSGGTGHASSVEKEMQARHGAFVRASESGARQQPTGALLACVALPHPVADDFEEFFLVLVNCGIC